MTGFFRALLNALRVHLSRKLILTGILILGSTQALCTGSNEQKLLDRLNKNKLSNIYLSLSGFNSFSKTEAHAMITLALELANDVTDPVHLSEIPFTYYDTSYNEFVCTLADFLLLLAVHFGVEDEIYGVDDALPQLLLLGANAQGTNGVVTPLHYAAKNGLVGTIKFLLLKGANIEVKDNKGKTPLHLAAEHGQDKTIKVLLHLRANIEVKDTNGRTPLHYAASESSFRAMKILLHSGANVNAQDNDLETPLHNVYEIEILRLLLHSGANIEAQDSHGMTPLYHAIDHACEEIIEEFVLQGANIEARDNSGSTPLHDAVKLCGDEGEYRARSKLIHLGADVTARNNLNVTPLLAAVLVGNAYWVAILIAYGAAVDFGTPAGTNSIIKDMLQIAREVRGDRALLEALLKFFTEDDDSEIAEIILASRARNGETALHVAVRLRLHAALAFVLKNGYININALNNAGYTALTHALINHDQVAINLLLDAEANAAVGNPSALNYANHVQVFHNEQSMTKYDGDAAKKRKLNSEKAQTVSKSLPSLVTILTRKVVSDVAAGLWPLTVLVNKKRQVEKSEDMIVEQAPAPPVVDQEEPPSTGDYWIDENGQKHQGQPSVGNYFSSSGEPQLILDDTPLSANQVQAYPLLPIEVGVIIASLVVQLHLQRK